MYYYIFSILNDIFYLINFILNYFNIYNINCKIIL